MRWRRLVVILILVTLAGGGIMFFRTKPVDNPKLIYFDMELTSPAFKYSESIPVKFTCDGQNISPPLQFSGIPVEAKSLALLMWDPDVPRTIRLDGNWDHWVVFNMPPSAKGIAEGARPNGMVGVNTRGAVEYGGPCPPDSEHRYFFKLFALDQALDLSGPKTREEVQAAMRGHIIAEAELMGRYFRRQE